MTAEEAIRYLKSVRDSDPLMGECADAIEAELKKPRFSASEREALAKFEEQVRIFQGHPMVDWEELCVRFAATIRAMMEEK